MPKEGFRDTQPCRWEPTHCPSRLPLPPNPYPLSFLPLKLLVELPSAQLTTRGWCLGRDTGGAGGGERGEGRKLIGFPLTTHFGSLATEENVALRFGRSEMEYRATSSGYHTPSPIVNLKALINVYLFFFLSLCILRECMSWGTGKERGRERESQAGSMLTGAPVLCIFIIPSDHRALYWCPDEGLGFSGLYDLPSTGQPCSLSHTSPSCLASSCLVCLELSH